jgi:hypothetical protein
MQERKPYRKKSKLGYGERHRNSELVRRPVGGRRDNRAVAVYVTSGANSEAIKHGRLDGRSTIGKAYREDLAALKAHLNHDVSVPEAKLCDQAARLGLLCDLSWAEITKEKTLIKAGEPLPCIDIYLRAAKAQRDVLRLLGLRRHAKDVTLSDVLQGRVDHEEMS